MTTGVHYSDSSGTVTTIPSDADPANSLAGDFRTDNLTVYTIHPHYVAGGIGTPLILPPDRPQTWWDSSRSAPTRRGRFAPSARNTTRSARTSSTSSPTTR
ncbi:hypothetical protein [Saccharothrix sp. NRRL B-16348]|uniref:hypothetical protein n=1 Tax=Saccharothrix sp. NRRL B-16348 TaxID=1415542 RepID=UPI000A7AAC2E|nr:hypothetical protein [Saccharothrix sp. NRRL B-16348]